MGTSRESIEEDAAWVRTIIRLSDAGAGGPGTKDRQLRDECYRNLFEKHWKLVAVVAAQKLGDKQDAEEVAQEAFIRAFRAITHLSEPVAFLGWLLRITQNLVTDRLRARRNTVSLDSLGDGAYASRLPNHDTGPTVPGDDVQRTLELEEESAMALRVLRELPERYREVLTLRYLEGLDGKDMARVLGEPEGTVRNRLFRALEKMRARLDPLKVCKS